MLGVFSGPIDSNRAVDADLFLDLTTRPGPRIDKVRAAPGRGYSDAEPFKGGIPHDAFSVKRRVQGFNTTLGKAEFGRQVAVHAPAPVSNFGSTLVADYRVIKGNWRQPKA